MWLFKGVGRDLRAGVWAWRACGRPKRTVTPFVLLFSCFLYLLSPCIASYVLLLLFLSSSYSLHYHFSLSLFFFFYLIFASSQNIVYSPPSLYLARISTWYSISSFYLFNSISIPFNYNGHSLFFSTFSSFYSVYFFNFYFNRYFPSLFLLALQLTMQTFLSISLLKY